MNFYKTAVIFALSCCFAACGRQSPATADAPAAAPVTGSTAPAQAGGILSAPADYVKNTVSQVDKAKEAKALYEQTEKERMKVLEQASPDGN
ncbi:MAG: hypothetical protein HY796_07825 [Elusimicrobia bacterium]|nr:hypothetical protein [Elusimicrobiota bacterium]